jgi:hypothetical protein
VGYWGTLVTNDRLHQRKDWAAQFIKFLTGIAENGVTTFKRATAMDQVF